MYALDDYRKIGIGLSTGGLLFTILGVLMFFDRGLLAMGNVRFPLSAVHGACAHDTPHAMSVATTNLMLQNRSAASLPRRGRAHDRA